MSRGFASQGRGFGVSGRALTQSVIPDSVVHHYDFEEGSGSTAVDREGDDDGSINGAAYVTDAPKGEYALSFETDDYVSFPQELPAGAATTALWVKINSHKANHSLLNQWEGGGSESWIFEVNDDGSGSHVSISVTVDGAMYTASTPDGSLSTGTQYHIAAAHDPSSGELTIFLDGSVSETVSTPSSDRVSTTNPLELGKQSGTSNRYLDGVTDDVFIATEALSEDQVNDLKNR